MMNRFKWLIKMLMIFSIISISYHSFAGSTKKVSLSLEWRETDHVLYRQNCALKSLQPCTLTLLAGSNIPVFLTITNNSTRTTAINIHAILPPALADIAQNAANCAQLLPSQQCQIAFTPGNMVHPATTVPVRGDNTMSYDVIIQVIADSFTVGGTITGLTAEGLVLQNNSGNNLLVSNGSTSFEFLALRSGDFYNVTVLTQPSGLSCSVTNGSGIVVMSNITNVSVTCLASNRFAYVPNFNNGTLSRCNVNQTTGLFDIGSCSSILSGLLKPSNITINPAKTLAYIANMSPNNDGSITRCEINSATGDLVNCALAITLPPFTTPQIVVFNPLGTQAYFLDTMYDLIYLCSVDSVTGNLSGCSHFSPNIGGPGYQTIALNKAGTYIYIAGGDLVAVCPIGTLGVIVNSCTTISGFSSPNGLTLNLLGTYIYIANDGSKNVSLCQINSNNGTLSDCGTLGFALNRFSGPGKVAFNTTGTKAYIPNARSNPTTNEVNVCDANPTTGTLSNCVISPPTTFFQGPAGLAIY